MLKNKSYLFIVLVLIVVILYPKFPLLAVSGSFVAIRLEDILIALISIFWLVGSRKKIAEIKNLPLHRTIILFLMIGAIATFGGIFLSKTVVLSQGILHWTRRIEYLIGFFIAYDVLKNQSQLVMLIKTLLVSSFFVSIYGIGQKFFNFPLISTTNSEFAKGLALTLGPGARINSTFAGHYDLAAFAIIPIIISVGLLTLKIKNKWLLIINMAMIYWTMLLSASRITFASLFVSVGILLFLTKKYTWMVCLVVIAIISIIGTPQLAGRYRELIVSHLISIVPTVSAQEESKAVDSEVPDALKPAATPEDRSLNIRLKAEWPKALLAFKKNPLLGSGYSSVGLAVDNDYLRIMAETGLLGFFAFILILVRIYRNFFEIVKQPSSISSIFVISISLGLLSTLITGLFIDIFEASKIAIIIWICLGLSEKVKTWELKK